MPFHVPTVPPLVPEGASFAFGQSPFHAKGVLYLGTLSFFEANLQGGVAAFLAEVESPELRAFVSQKFLPSSWYDVMAVPGLIAYEARTLRMGLEEYLVHRTRWQAKRDLGGVYGWVLKLASPSAVVARLPKVFAQMFDFATVTVPVVADNRATTVMSGIPEPLERWLVTALGVYAETALKLAGARFVEPSVQSQPAGARGGLPLVQLNIDIRWS